MKEPCISLKKSATVVPVGEEVRIYGVEITSLWFRAGVLILIVFIFVLTYVLENY